MSTSSDSQALRILQLTDPHLFADRSGSLRGAVTWQTLNETIEHYLAGSFRADIVYLTGDLVQDDSRGAYQNLRDAVARLGMPVHLVPGNHDVPALVAEELGDFAQCSTLETPGWRIVGVDTQEVGSAGGCVGDSELARLERAHAALAAIRSVEAAGGKAVYHSVNLTDAARVDQVVE